MRLRAGDFQTARDFGLVLGLAVLSLGIGLGVNCWRSSPLPLSYRSPEQRLEAELNQLIKAPVFTLSDFPTVSLDDLRRAVAQQQILILDARAAAFYDAGHVPGALNLSRQDFARNYIRLRSTLAKSKDAPIVVYCSGGDCHDSRMVASALVTLGYSQVKIFPGGWLAWSAAGEPVAP
jgi:rhodanese-related sulfurtransferase